MKPCDTKTPENRRLSKFPNVMRYGIVGPSGSGKTTILLNSLARMDLPKNIYLCCKTTNQKNYRLLNMANS